MPARMLTGGVILVTLTGTVSNRNLWTLAGSPSGVVNVLCNIVGGAIVYGSTTTNAGLLIPVNFALGCGITLVFYEASGVYGAGGDGGDGGNGNFVTNGQLGRAGGTAISTFRPINISVASGFIFAGGAGGKGGDASPGLGGSGGGGGQGYVGGGKGFGGPGVVNGQDGTNGGFAGPGNGGGGAIRGADGKTWGGYGSGTQPQASAVNTNGQGAGAITWLDGYDLNHVKGRVG